MGNKRARTLFIGTIVAAISVVLAFSAIIPAIHEIETVSTGLKPLGHVSLVVYDPDGNVVAYRQGDNFVSTTVINAVGNTLFDGTAIGLGTFNFLGLCNGVAGGATATAQTDNACTSPLTTARVSGAGTGSSESEMTGAGGNYNRVLSNTFVIAVADAGETVGELGIFDASTTGNMLAVATFASFVAQNGGNVLGTYTVTITG